MAAKSPSSPVQSGTAWEPPKNNPFLPAEPVNEPGASPDKTVAPILDVQNLHVKFGKQAVLRDIYLQIPPGQTVAVIGESGCGKTVLMKSLIGLVRPTFGRVLFDKQNLAELSERDLAKQRTRYGFVFQMAALFDSLTIGQNVAFPLREHTDKPLDEIEAIVIDRLAQVGLPANVILKKPAQLSGGMRKRVGLARALALDPEVVLYDEPTTGLDPIMSDVINELIMRTRERRPVTSVIVTHDMKTALKVADRIVMVYPLPRLRADEPQVIFDGTPAEVAATKDLRVRQFVAGEAGDRLLEMQNEQKK